jgi:hypothetical protein
MQHELNPSNELRKAIETELESIQKTNPEMEADIQNITAIRNIRAKIEAGTGADLFHPGNPSDQILLGFGESNAAPKK